jgi:penicillin amidase
MLEAFADGVNAYVAEGPLPLEFGLLGYAPRDWSVVASLLVDTQVAWGLTGSFRTLRRALLRDRLDADTYRNIWNWGIARGLPSQSFYRVGIQLEILMRENGAILCHAVTIASVSHR